MKHISIRLKITLWYTAALTVVVLFTGFIVLYAGNQILQKTTRDSLIETVEHNVDEIEFFAELDLTNDVDQLIQYKDGYLEIDDDFLDHVNEVYTALYLGENTLLYGENPIPKETAGLLFADTRIQKIKVGGTVYYVFDRQLTQNGLEGLWLRGVVSELQGKGQTTDMARISLILLPAVLLLAVIGGYWISGKMLSPIKRLSETALQIEKGGDLKNRIVLGKGNDELHQLAESFNGMLQRLEASFEAERRFTADASHELRTPMAVITAQCAYSLEEQRTPESYAEALQVIQRQGAKMSKLIEDLLDFTRLEMQTDCYVLEPLDLTELVSALCADMALIRKKGITLQCEAAENIVYTGNRVLLTRLLTNLTSNAYRYGKENGHIWVKLIEKEQGIELSVADDGIGIAPDEQEKIFNRFYRSDNSRTGSGTGLGLAMAAEIAKFHSGELRVESVYGAGSVFILNLPK